MPNGPEPGDSYPGFYGLGLFPFQLTPDSRFLYLSQARERFIAYLKNRLVSGQGHIVLTGESGVGKTALIDFLFPDLDKGKFVLVKVVPDRVERDAFLHYIAGPLGIDLDTERPAELRETLRQSLIGQARAARPVFVIVDDAHRLQDDALRDLDWIAGLRSENRFLVPTLLVGLPELREQVARVGLAQSIQPVPEFRVAPLSAEETRAYVEHRLTIAGWQNDPAFTDQALQIVHQVARGFPSRINRFCDRLLLRAFRDEMHEIDALMAEAVCEELVGVSDDMPSPLLVPGRRTSPSQTAATSMRSPTRAASALASKQASDQRSSSPAPVAHRPGPAHQDLAEGPYREKREAPLWRRRSFFGATLALFCLSIVALALLWQSPDKISEPSPSTGELAQQLENERSITSELRGNVEALSAALQAAKARQEELEIVINEIRDERDRRAASVKRPEPEAARALEDQRSARQALDARAGSILALNTKIGRLEEQRERLKAELAAAKDRRATVEAERRELSEDLKQARALVARQSATIETQTSEIARMSDRVNELEPSKQSDSVTDVPSGAAASKDLSAETPPKAPQIAARERLAGPSEFLEALSGKVVRIYQSNGIASEGRARLLRDLLHETVDLTSMSKSILGSHWQEADTRERAKYLSLVEGYLFRPMIRMLEGDGVRGMQIVEARPLEGSGTLVRTRLDTLTGDVHTLSWKIRKRDNAYMAVDLHAQGVSLFKALESELQSYVARNGVAALLETLEARDQDLHGASQRVP